MIVVVVVVGTAKEGIQANERHTGTTLLCIAKDIVTIGAIGGITGDRYGNAMMRVRTCC